MVFYAQSTITVIPGRRFSRESKRFHQFSNKMCSKIQSAFKEDIDKVLAVPTQSNKLSKKTRTKLAFFQQNTINSQGRYGQRKRYSNTIQTTLKKDTNKAIAIPTKSDQFSRKTHPNITFLVD